jgi:hypothetical protein
MIRSWREWFGSPALWFGFVQIAGYAYSRPVPAAKGGMAPDTARSRAAGDLRQVRATPSGRGVRLFWGCQPLFLGAFVWDPTIMG